MEAEFTTLISLINVSHNHSAPNSTASQPSKNNYGDGRTGVYPQNFEWPVCLCVGSPCPLYPLPTYQKDANVIMILEGSYNHLANSAGMG